MTYIPEKDGEQLRAALQLMQRSKVSLDSLLHALDLSRPQGFVRTHENTVSRSTLQRIIDGSESIKTLALSDLYDFMKEHPNYKGFFVVPEVSPPLPPPPAPLDAAVFGASLMGFLLSADGAGLFKIDNARKALPGKYLMYRPNFAGAKHKQGFFRASQLDIEERDGVLCVTETQDFPEETPDYQRDTGAFASLGQYGYFLMRQVAGGNSLKLMVMNKALPEVDSGVPVKWFQGVIFVASHVDIFPAARFFCRRRREGDSPLLGSIKLHELNDREALLYLSAPVLTGE